MVPETAGARSDLLRIVEVDGDEAAALAGRLWPDSLRNWSPDALAASMRAGASCWVARDSEALGYCLERRAGDAVEILELVVFPPRRRQGIGRLLLSTVLQRAAAAGHARAWLEVRGGNRVAISLYRALGFTQSGLRRNYYRGPDRREDALLMTRGGESPGSSGGPGVRKTCRRSAAGRGESRSGW